MNKYFKKNINHLMSQPKPLFYLFRKIICHLVPYLPSSIVRKLSLKIERDGYVLLGSKSPFSRSLYLVPWMRREDEMFIGRVLKEGDIMIDVGGNIGTTTLCGATKVGNNGKVYCIEPHPETFASLSRSVNHNKHLVSRIELLNVACGRNDEEAYITNFYSDDLNRIVYDEKDALKVEVKTLDSLFPTINDVRLLKIDVEGFEEKVLMGAKELLKRTQIIYFELSSTNYDLYGSSFEKIFNYLNQVNFTLYTMFRGKIVKLDKDYRGNLECENIIALKKGIDICDLNLEGIQSNAN